MLLLILLLVPLIEIGLFVVIGERIGLAATLATVLITALIGATALRVQGTGALRRAQHLESADALPELLVDGLLMFAAALLLLTPGFLTDAMGLTLLVPWTRRWIGRRIGRWLAMRVMHTGGFSQRPGAPPPAVDVPPSPSDRAHRGRESHPDRDADDAIVLDEDRPNRE